MWENEIVVLLSSLKKKILAGKDKVHFRKIAADETIPEFVKANFQRRYEGYLSNEMPLTIQSTAHFVFSEDEINKFKDRFKEVLRDIASFPTTEVEEVLKDAILVRLDYFVKPIDTMRRLLFTNNQQVELGVMKKTLMPFQEDLSYAGQVIEAFGLMNKNQIDSNDYGQVANNVLHRVLKTDPITRIMEDFAALTQFLSETKGEQVEMIEGSMLHEFLVDRNTWGFRRAIEVEMKLGKKEFNTSDLEMTLKRYMEFREDFKKDDEGSEQKIETQPVPEPVPVKEKTEVPRLEIDALDIGETLKVEEPEEEKTSLAEETDEKAEENIWEIGEEITKHEKEEIKQEEKPVELEEIKKVPEPVLEFDDLIEDETEDIIEEAVPEKETIEEKSNAEEEPAAQPAASPNQKQMRIIRRDQKEEEEETIIPDDTLPEEVAAPPAEIQGLRAFIDGKTEKLFIKKLFGGDDAAYGRLLDKLDEAESWRVAKILIDNELFKRDVDPFSREAIKLVDLVYTRYYPEEGVGGKK